MRVGKDVRRGGVALIARQSDAASATSAVIVASRFSFQGSATRYTELAGALPMTGRCVKA